MSGRILNLDGNWKFAEYPSEARRMEDLESANWLAGSVPSSIFTCLRDSGSINAGELCCNPENFEWVSQLSWIFCKEFDAVDLDLKGDRIELVFEGLDTKSTIWFNDKLIGRTENMFTEHVFDVTSLVQEKANRLFVRFEPAEEHARKLMERYTDFPDNFSKPHRTYIRKAQYQFGWDFCPAMEGCGIYRSVYLRSIDTARLADVHIRTVEANEKFADIRLAIQLDAAIQKKLTAEIEIRTPMGLILTEKLEFQPPIRNQATLIRIDSPELWYPAGYGKQPLYDITTRLFCQDRLIDSSHHRLGIRTIRLDRTPDIYGRKFQFSVNYIPIYIKGVNMSPATIFPGEFSAGDYEKLVVMASEANINMIRVWAGGYYPGRSFYETADRLGILIWQDFMFASGYYPDRDFFFDQIKDEFSQIIRRLRSHSCLALWCGNSEIDWTHALSGNRKYFGKKIFHEILPGILSELDPDRDYIPSTPLDEGKKLNDPDCGTVHQWDVWASRASTKSYLTVFDRIPRFVTEFGLASLPGRSVIDRLIPKKKTSAADYSIEKHCYDQDGIAKLNMYMSEELTAAADIDNAIYCTQLTQARAFKLNAEHLRTSPARNYGLMMWQLKSCCAAIDWSAIDCSFKPKAVYYYMKRYYGPFMIAMKPIFKPTRERGINRLAEVVVMAANHSADAVGMMITCSLVDTLGRTADKIQFPVTIQPYACSNPIKLPREFAEPLKPFEMLLHMSLVKDGCKIAENVYSYVPDKYLRWEKPDIKYTLEQLDVGHIQMNISSDKPVRDLFIETDPDCKLSDNFIDLIDKEEKQLIISAEKSGAVSRDMKIRLRCINQLFT